MSKNWSVPVSVELATTDGAVKPNKQLAVHIGFVVCMLAFVGLYVQNYLSLIVFWASSDLYQYALLIFPVSAFLVWARRDWLAQAVARPRPLALWVLAGLGLLWLLGAAAQVNLAMQIVMIIVWPVMVYLFYGPRVTRMLAFPLGYLLFAIPFRAFAMEYMVVPLQTITAHLAVFALGFTSVPVLMEGHFISTPVTTWHVAKACSGISFFLATSAFGFLYAYLFFNRLRRRLIFIAFALVVPIIANALRVFFTILIGEYFGLEYATGTDHLIFGWQFFGTVLVLLFFCGWPWHEPLPKPPEPDASVPKDGGKRMRWIFPVALVLVVLPGAWYAGTGLLASRYPVPESAELPLQLAGQPLVKGIDDDASVGVAHRGEIHVLRRYGSRARPIQVEYLGSRVGQDGPEFVNVVAQLYDPAQWQVASGPLIVPGKAGGLSFAALKLSARYGSGHRLLLYAYRIGPHWTTSPVRFKVRKMLTRLRGRPAPVGILAVSIDGADSASRLTDVANAAAKALRQAQP